jgi:hypothetical protein
MIALGALQMGCGSSPTSPTSPSTAVMIKGVSKLITSANPQTITVNGTGFKSGLVLTISGVSTEITNILSGAQITNVTSTSFQATTVFASAGMYDFQVTNPDGAASGAFELVLEFTCSSPAPAPDTAPYIGNRSGQPIPQAVRALSPTEVAIYATIFEDNTPSQLCSGSEGACSYVDTSSVTGACDSVAWVLCACELSGWFEARVYHTASSGTCSATFRIHDVCGVSGTTTLTFELPPPSLLDLARQFFADPFHQIVHAAARPE